MTAARGGDQREASGTPGVSVGEAPHATRRRTPQTERNVQPPRRECRRHTRPSAVPVKTHLFSFSLYFLQLESSRKLSEIKSLHDKIRVSTEEAKKKEELYKQLVRDCFVLNCQHDRRGVSRSVGLPVTLGSDLVYKPSTTRSSCSYMGTGEVWKSIRATYESVQNYVLYSVVLQKK